MDLVLFRPEIAQNAGAATRAAACFEAGLHIIEPCGFPLDARGFRRAALDYGLLAPPVRHASWRAFEKSEARAGRRLILLTTKAAASIWSFDFADTDLIMVGQESAGAPDEVHAACDASLRIPIAPAARSLNAATAAAIALAAARRPLPDERIP
ncbi:MAG: tRNA (cytidine(34)-2'-O)-methyltransferase [Parvularculaceae bacterium]